MTANELTTTPAAVLREHLRRLERERALAVLTGLADNALYMRSLSDEMEAVGSAYVGAAVTEIASLRAALGSPLLG